MNNSLLLNLLSLDRLLFDESSIEISLEAEMFLVIELDDGVLDMDEEELDVSESIDIRFIS